MNKAKCSAAGKALAECRWGKSGGKKKKKAAAKPKSSAPPRRSRRLAGVTARQPEPKKKPPRKARKKQLTPVQLLLELKAAGQDTSGQAAVNRMNSAVGNMERRAAVRRDGALARRIRNIEFR